MIWPTAPLLGWLMVGLALSVLLWGWWPKIPSRVRHPLSRRRKLFIEPSIAHLSHLYDQPGRSVAMIESGLLKREFAVLKVQNRGKMDLHRVVPVCTLASGSDSVIKLPCFWAKEEDGKFSLGGSPSADLSVWHVRVLVIGQVFGAEKLWARLPASQTDLLLIPAFRDKGLAEKIGDARVVSPAGERLDLGETAEVTVRFHAERFYRSERFLLSFNVDGPTISCLS